MKTTRLAFLLRRHIGYSSIKIEQQVFELALETGLMQQTGENRQTGAKTAVFTAEGTKALNEYISDHLFPPL